MAAWGMSEASADGTSRFPRFTGQRQETMGGEAGLYDYRTRYYDPALGRFIQPDTMVPNPFDPQSLNRMSYVRNNPVRYRDPSGHAKDEGDLTDNPEEPPPQEPPWVPSQFPEEKFDPEPLVSPGYCPPIRVPWHQGEVPFGEQYSSPSHLVDQYHVGEDFFPEDPNADIPVYSVTSGIVVTNDWYTHEEGEGKGYGYGWYVVIEYTLPNGDKVYIYYCHLAEQSPLEVGTEVQAGDPIGTMGNTGTDEKHLHFEIRTAAGRSVKGSDIASQEDLYKYRISPFQFLAEQGVLVNWWRRER